MERVRAPRNDYFNVKRVRKPRNYKSTGKQYFDDKNG